MNVEIWSDVVCPWCYIGKRRFEAALQRFAGAADVSVTFRAFQLDPGAPPGAATPVSEVYERKFGPGQADQLIDRVTTLAAECGLDHDEVLGYLASDAGQAEVATDLTEAFELGITAVPTYVFDGRWSVPGAQDPDTFLRVLERVAELEAAGTEPS